MPKRYTPTSAAADVEPDEIRIRALLEAWAAAVRRHDVPAILAHHDPDMVMFDVPPPFQSRGIEAYRATWATFFAWSHEPTVFDIQDMQVVAGEDVAFAFATMRCAGREASGEDIDLDFRLTVGLRRIGDRWTIVHEHHSIPAED